MIIYAFPTLGKTRYAEANAGKVVDLECGKFARMLGYTDQNPDKQCVPLCLAASALAKAFSTVLVTRPLPVCNLIVLPSFDIHEYERRLSYRYGDEFRSSEEWERFGGTYFKRKVDELASYAYDHDITLGYSEELTQAIRMFIGGATVTGSSKVGSPS